MNETQVIQGVSLIPDDQSPEIAEPGEGALNFPPPSVPAQRAAILHLGPGAIAPIGCDHLDPQQLQSGIQRIRIVAFVPDQPLRALVDEAGVEGGSDKGNLARPTRCATR
jgi:hypothetical protein